MRPIVTKHLLVRMNWKKLDYYIFIRIGTRVGYMGYPEQTDNILGLKFIEKPEIFCRAKLKKKNGNQRSKSKSEKDNF